MSKHTPGPWRFATKSNFGNLIEADSGKRGGIGAGLLDEGYRTVAMYQACCASERYDDQEENRLANGHLIAAAPELLEALQIAWLWIDNWEPAFVSDEEWTEVAGPLIRAALAKATGEQ
jgi:hypothetical protein